MRSAPELTTSLESKSPMVRSKAKSLASYRRSEPEQGEQELIQYNSMKASQDSETMKDEGEQAAKRLSRSLLILAQMAPRKKATSKRASAASTPVPIELPTEQPPSSPLTSLNALGSLPTTSRIPSSLNNGSAAARRAPPSAFTDFRTALNKELATVTEKLRQRRAVGAQAGLEEQVAGELVEGVIDAVGRSAEGDEVQEYEKNVRRAAIERALEEMLFDVVSCRRLPSFTSRVSSLDFICRRCTPWTSRVPT